MATPIRASALVASVLVLAACQGGGTPSQSEGDAPASAAASAGPVESGATAEALEAKIGAALSLTGPAAVYGTTQQNGLQLALDEVNAAGDLQLELVIEDDASDPQQGINVFQKFINQDGVNAIIGPTLSNTAFSADPIAQEAGVPVLGISNTASGITEIGDFIFRASLTEAQVIPQTIAAVQEEFTLERVAIMYGNDDAFTQSGFEVFEQALADSGLEVTTTETFAKGDRDFAAQLTKIAGTEPDALIVSALAEEAAGIIAQARDLGLDVPIVGGNGFNSPAIIANAGEAAEGVVVGAAWNSAAENPENEAFLAAYEEAFDAAPDQFATQAYTGLKILAEAITRAGSTDATAIRDALAEIAGLPTPLGEFSFTDARDALHPVVVQIVEGGEFTVLTTQEPA